MKNHPIYKCIYCNKEEKDLGKKLSDEHVVPHALGGKFILPRSSCDDCARITSRFEGDITRAGGTYFHLRTKKKFPSRREKERPENLPIYFRMPNGEDVKIGIPINDFPTIYPILSMPPPGILSGLPPSDKNPEMSISLKYENQDFNNLREKYCPDSVGFSPGSIPFKWGSFCRCLAKIAHSATVATFGFEKYEMPLKEIILGTSDHISHYIGGLIPGYKESEIPSNQDGISISVNDDGYVIVNISLLGGRTPNYSVVSAKFEHFHEALSFVSKHSRKNDKNFDHELSTRCLFNHDWALWISNVINNFVDKNYSNLVSFWPMRKSFKFEAYALPPRHIVLVMEDSKDDVPSGPEGRKIIPGVKNLSIKIREENIYDLARSSLKCNT